MLYYIIILYIILYYIVWASEGSNLQPILFPLGCSSAVFFCLWRLRRSQSPKWWGWFNRYPIKHCLGATSFFSWTSVKCQGRWPNCESPFFSFGGFLSHGGTPKSSIIDHPAIGVPPSMEPPNGNNMYIMIVT